MQSGEKGERRVQVKCPICGSNLTAVRANVSFEREGIDLLVIGARGIGCEACQTVFEMAPNVEKAIEESLAQKQQEFSDSPPVLTLNMLE